MWCSCTERKVVAELEASDAVGSMEVWISGSVSAHEIVLGLFGRGLRVRVWNCSEVERVVVAVDRERKMQAKEKKRVDAFLAFPSID